MNRRHGDLAPWAVAILFFAGLPMALLLLGWRFLMTQETARLTRQHLHRLERNLFRLHREGNESHFIQKELNFFYGRLNEERLTAQTAREAYLRLKTSRLPFVNLYLFDTQGAFIPCPGEHRQYKALVQKLFLALAEPEMHGQSKLLARYRSLFQSFLGDIEPSDIVYDKSVLLRVHLNGKPGFFYWNTLYLNPPAPDPPAGDGRPAEPTFQGGVVAFFEEREIPRQQAIRTMIRDFNQAADPDEGYALLDLARPADSYVPRLVRRRLRTSTSRLVREARVLQRQFARQKIDPARVMAIFPFEPGKVLVGLHGLHLPGYGRLRLLIWALALVILLAVASWSHRILVGRTPAFFSIKRKLVALFLYATAIPVTAFILLGSQYAVEERQVMIQEQYAQLASLLETIDENFNAAVQRLQEIFRRLSRSKAVARLDQARLRRITDRLRQQDLLSKAFILDQKGKMLFDAGFEKGRDLMGRFVPTLARKLFTSKFGAGGSDLGTRMSDVMVESLTDSFAELVSGGGGGKSAYARLFEQTDQLHEFWFGRGAYFLFTAFVPAPAGPHPNVLILMQSAQDLARRYLRTVVRLNQQAREEEKPVRLAMMSRLRGYAPYPPGFSKYPFGKELFDKVLTTETQHTAIEEMGGEPYLVLAAPLKKLPNFLLFAMFPKSRIDAVVDQLARRIALIAIISGVFAFCIGLVLSRSFLWPITELSSGIAAIERRQFDYRIPELAHDEFGDLGSTFNRVITSLEELAIGKVVQETLFPAGPLTLGEFEIAGRSQAVSDLGGDYFDYFALDQRFAVVLVGDVTGHGVPAALLMAMAKSAVKIRPPAAARAVLSTLEELNAHLFETIKRKRLMTMLYGVVDAHEHHFTFANAGHSFPYFFARAPGRATQVECTAFPLGARRQGRFEERRVAFSPGDQLILYTDGLVEAQTTTGQALGYEGFRQLLEKTCPPVASATESVDAIFQAFRQTTGQRPCEDDLTLIVVRRQEPRPARS
jgi:HAMP domain-containing protein